MEQDSGQLAFHLIGGLEVRRGDQVLVLPPSKKTRALLGYLVLSGRTHRREALCNLLWDVTDDPRGALRWSLSKLRKLVDDDTATRLLSDREKVTFEAHGAHVDVLDMRAQLTPSELPDLPLSVLEPWCEQHAGEVLEGLDLPDFDVYQAWLVAEREHVRRLRASAIAALVSRLLGEPERALPHARTWTRADPMNTEAHLSLMRLSMRAGRPDDAKRHYEAARRNFAELDPQKERALTAAWHTLRSDSGAPPQAEAKSTPVKASKAGMAIPRFGETTLNLSRKLAGMLDLTGRAAEQERLEQALAEVGEQRRAQLIVVTGEPGIGKSRLLDELILKSRCAGHGVLNGAAYEGEAGRPYGVWIDALRRLARTDEATAAWLAPLSAGGTGDSPLGSREAWFDGVAQVIDRLAVQRPPLLVVLEDAHWLDEASAELLHFVVRMEREAPVLFALSARHAELSDSRSVLRVLRSLRRDVEQSDLPLGPLAKEATEALVAGVAEDVDTAAVHARSGGNPLYALELARAGGEPARDGSLADAVLERVDRLTPEAADALRWCAVLGSMIDPKQLAPLSSLGVEQQLEALEELERHALLRHEGAGYGFSHDIVKQVVYGGLSQPRRVLMHQRAAEVLQRAQTEVDGAFAEALVADIARHAALAGNHQLAAQAYVAAGQRCLRMLASQNAAVLAVRGLRHARELHEPERSQAMLELYEVQLSAARPHNVEAFCEEIQALAETALSHGDSTHARLGFNMVSYVRWEHGDWSSAREKMRMAEASVRGGDGEIRVEALAQAARCEALLQRDMSLAESFLREAQAHVRAERLPQISQLVDAEALIRRFAGEFEDADALFQSARVAAQTGRGRFAELQALLSRIELLYDWGQLDKAQALAEETVELAEKAREGSEEPYARALSALCRWGHGQAAAEAEFTTALHALRVADAKHRATFAMSRGAQHLLALSRPREALTLAREATEMAQLLEWPTEMTLALVTVLRICRLMQDAEGFSEAEALLATVDTTKASAHARAVLSRWREEG